MSEDQYNAEEELLEAYLRGELSQAEKDRLEARLAAEPALRQALEELRAVHDLVRHDGRMELKQRLEQMHEELAPFTQKSRSINTWLAMAAGIAVLITVGLTFFLTGGTKTPEALYAEYYAPFEDVVTTLGDDDSQLKQAMTPYNEQDYPAVIKALEGYGEEDPGFSAARLYLGIAYLETNQLPDAMRAFSEVVNQDDPLLKWTALWYAALTHLKQGNIMQCREVLQDIEAANPGKYGLMATELLSKLPDEEDRASSSSN